MVGWKILTGPWLRDPEGILVGNFGTTSGWGNQKDFLVGKRESEALGETDGDVVEWIERGCHLVKWMGPVLVNV